LTGFARGTTVGGYFFIVNIEIKDVSATRKNMVATLTQSEVAAEHAAVVAEFVKYARLPGFRPGKAPAAMVQKQFARQIDEDFKQKITAKAYQDGLKESKLDVLNVIDLQTGDIKAGTEATITVTVDVRPTFELPGYNGIAVTVAPVDPTAEEIDAAIDELRHYGLQTWAAFTVGHDTDTVESIKETVAFAMRNKFTFAAFNILSPYPGTPFYDRLAADGRLLYGGRWWLDPTYRFNYAAFVPAHMTADELTQTAFWCRRRFNSSRSRLHRSRRPYQGHCAD